jgi:DNA repair protein RecN (Recombination protein N)
MLHYLNIKDFKLIEELEVEFDNGLNIITGETGAGKSIILSSISFLMGGRGERSFIRKGKDKTVVSGVILVDNKAQKKLINNLGFELEDNSVFIKRQISKNGSQLIKINGEICSKTVLLKVSKILISIHSQNENLSLFDSNKQIQIIDAFGSEKLFDLKKEIKEEYNQLLKDIDYSKNLKSKIDYYEKNNSLLYYQIEELSNFFIKKIDEEDLDAELTILSNVDNIQKTLLYANHLLSIDNENALSVSSIIENCISSFNKLNICEEFIDDTRENLIDIHERLIDISRGINIYLEGLAFDESRFNEINEALSEISELKRKYKKQDLKELAIYYKSLLDAKINYNNQLDDYNNLNSKIETNKVEIYSKASTLRNERLKIASFLEKEITDTIIKLNMHNAELKIRIEKNQLTSNGIDIVSFLIKTTKNGNFEKLDSVLSGGELSRMFFAIKSVIAKVDSVSTLIFDEIDTGISGRTSQIIAEKLFFMSKKNQVICITHSPQIAAFSKVHIHIDKVDFEDREVPQIRYLSRNERVEEISRLIAGKEITALIKESANEILSFAEQIKNQNGGD